MMKHALTTGIIIMGMFNSSAEANGAVKEFTFQTLISEQPIKLADYQGKVILIVNTASKCGFTVQYKGLEALYQKYKDKGLVVIGVPSNDFGAQEPGTDKEIASFCQINFGVTFPITEKYNVKGKNAHPFYKYAQKQLGFGTAPKWNFHKYLINRNGELIDYFYSTTKPNATRLIKAIESALAEE